MGSQPRIQNLVRFIRNSYLKLINFGWSPEVKIRSENGDPAENSKSDPFYKEFVLKTNQFRGGRRKSKIGAKMRSQSKIQNLVSFIRNPYLKLIILGVVAGKRNSDGK